MRFSARKIAARLSPWMVVAFFLLPPQAHSQTESEWMSYLEGEVAKIAQSTSSELASITKDNWPTTQEEWRGELREMLGIPSSFQSGADSNELSTTTVGSINVDGVRIDRLHYQAMPGLYVASNLYVPTEEAPEQGWPAVLYVCGHARVTEHGRLLGNKTNYQHHGLWLARHGVVCLMIDTIQLGELHGEHHGTYKLGRWDWISRGYTPAGVEAVNSIRGIDLLVARGDVDANRIGITGRSGGGIYSWLATALDDRIKVAVPVAGITDLHNHVIDDCVSGHCDCMYFVNYHRWDYGKLAALVAPRALLFANSDSDRIFPLDGVLRIHNQLSGLYTNLDAADRLGLIITPGPHKDTQELQVGAFKWLLKHLTGNEPVISSAALKELASKQLQVFEAETPSNEQVTTAPNWFAGTSANREKQLDGAQLVEKWKTKWLPELRRLRCVPHSADDIHFDTIGHDGAGEQRWQLMDGRVSDGKNKIQILKIGSSSSLPALVHFGVSDSETWNADSIQRVTEGPEVNEILQQLPGRTHVFIKWRGSHWLNSLADPHRRHQLARRFYLLGQSTEQVALGDYLSALKWLGTSDHTISGTEFIGRGRAGSMALMAALMAAENDALPTPSKLHLSIPPTDPLLNAVLPGILRVCTFQDLYAVANEMMDVEASNRPIQPKRLVDTSARPQQANGLRIVEVSQNRVSVWMRATRWPLPNLGDLAEVKFESPAEGNSKKNVGAILPDLRTAGLRYACPGVPAEARVGVRPSQGGQWRFSNWKPVTKQEDFQTIQLVEELRPGTRYDLQTQVRAPGADSASSTLRGSFQTLPAKDSLSSFRLAIGTCQAFIDRDGPHGFDMYPTMLNRKTNAFVMAGDVVYYDSLARNIPLAYYHWQRTYSLPTLVEFHKRVPTFFLKDDHDTYVNDTWPGSHYDWTGEFSFSDGQRIFQQETGLPDPAYRSFQIGKDLQVWMMEGRDFRSPNNAPDGPDKSIWGGAQKDWLVEGLRKSDAKFKLVISPTPLVGPDRDKKSDNHSNKVFAAEGKEVRALIADIPNTIIACGDRHWQYHSIDPASGLHEFSVGPASDRHAGGWKQEDFRPSIHQYLRVGGGYLEVDLGGKEDQRTLTLRHLDTHGNEHHKHVLR